MSSQEQHIDNNLILTPPLTSRGCRTLNREDFTKVLRLPALRIDAKKCSLFMKNFRRLLLNQPRLKNIVSDPNNQDNSKRIVLFRPGASLNEEEKKLICAHNAEEIVHDLVLEYDFWTSEQVLRAILPPEITEVPSAFETIGHIAHVNLRENQLEYKGVIGILNAFLNL